MTKKFLEKRKQKTKTNASESIYSYAGISQKYKCKNLKGGQETGSDGLKIGLYEMWINRM